MKWDYEKDIPYCDIDIDKIKDNDYLFQTLVIASFIEITSNVYEKNLSIYYKDDASTVKWLEDVWMPEEIQHGESLKKYIKTVWPEFDWEQHYEIFLNSYLPLCRLDAFEPTKAREMIARMVVETGTSTLYKGLANYAKEIGEPILEDLCHKISKDEVYHFEMFEKVFKKYKEEEKLLKKDIVKVLYDRLKEINNEDVKIAYEALQDDESYDDYMKQTGNFARKYYPYKMATKMFIRPLELNNNFENVIATTVKPAFKILGI